ncbi:hypothetical protein DFJ73DRAFT_811177 [Zopfochytrium polystomum]|nr:hypothetical protein DFJ73DRAFT_811177 [Zopfochytrium polystomum]
MACPDLLAINEVLVEVGSLLDASTALRLAACSRSLRRRLLLHHRIVWLRILRQLSDSALGFPLHRLACLRTVPHFEVVDLVARLDVRHINRTRASSSPSDLTHRLFKPPIRLDIARGSRLTPPQSSPPEELFAKFPGANWRPSRRVLHLYARSCEVAIPCFFANRSGCLVPMDELGGSSQDGKVAWAFHDICSGEWFRLSVRLAPDTITQILRTDLLVEYNFRFEPLTSQFTVYRWCEKKSDLVLDHRLAQSLSSAIANYIPEGDCTVSTESAYGCFAVHVPAFELVFSLNYSTRNWRDVTSINGTGIASDLPWPHRRRYCDEGWLMHLRTETPVALFGTPTRHLPGPVYGATRLAIFSEDPANKGFCLDIFPLVGFGANPQDVGEDVHVEGLQAMDMDDTRIFCWSRFNARPRASPLLVLHDFAEIQSIAIVDLVRKEAWTDQMSGITLKKLKCFLLDKPILTTEREL